MRIFSIQQTPVDVDVEKRILRNAVVATRSLATDGLLLDPAGMDVAGYLRNPVVEARHGKAETNESSVIGRSIEVIKHDTEIISTTQFADTQLARDYAYLYGVNPEGEVYMRAWSIDAPILSRRNIGVAEARRFAGDLFDEELAAAVLRKKALSLVTRSELKSYSAVSIGADRAALTRAWRSGLDTAGEILTRMDLDQAESEIEVLKRYMEKQDERIVQLEQDILALRCDGTAAAKRGDTAEILNELSELTALMNKPA